MADLVQIVGGPRDGEVVPYYGPYMREVVLTPARLLPERPLALEPYRYREYVLVRWSDLHGPTRGWRYVLREQAEALGA
jgi:hypothetical protein